MANLDVLTLDEGKQSINMESPNLEHEEGLARHISAVSGIIDDACGPVVKRTITAEIHDGGVGMVLLHHRPVVSITTVRIATSAGVIESLAPAAFGTTVAGYYAPTWSEDASLLSGALYRRDNGYGTEWPTGCQTVEVTYEAGRFASTALVDDRFKDAAGAVLRRLWKREAGAWAQSPTFFEDADNNIGVGFFRVARPIIEEMLAEHVQTKMPAIA